MGLSAEQIEQRKSLITASEAAAICGLSPFATAFDVYARKMGGDAWAGNYRTKRGDALEPLGVELLAQQLAPMTVKRSGDVTRTHCIFSWLGATPDALVLDGAGKEIAVGEIKTAGIRTAEHWTDETGEQIVPDYYLCQVQVQMTVCRLKRAHVVAMLDTEDDPRFYMVDHSPDNESAILEVCDDFRRKHLEPRIPPAPDGSESAYRMIKALFRRETKPLVLASPELTEVAREYFAALKAEKDAVIRKKNAQARICTAIGDHEGIDGHDWRATWKWRESTEVKAYVKEGYRHFDCRAVGAAKKGRAA